LVSLLNPYGLVFILFFGIYAYWIFWLPDNIEFDADFMYVIYKNGEIKVDLKDVYYISPRAGFMDNCGLGRIKYHYEDTDYLAQFTPRYFSSSFKKFKGYVLEKNPGATIKGYNQLFDFDS